MDKWVSLKNWLFWPNYQVYLTLQRSLVDQRGIFKFFHPGIVKRAVFPV